LLFHATKKEEEGGGKGKILGTILYITLLVEREELI
jgi:hypothetical protein